MSETKAVFAERTIRSLKYIFYRYMEDFGYKYIHKLRHFFTTLISRGNSSTDKRPNTLRNCNFMSILYSKPLREYKKLTFKTGDRLRISKSDLRFRKGYKPQLHEKFLKLWQLQLENHQHTQSRMSKARLFKVNFIKRS